MELKLPPDLKPASKSLIFGRGCGERAIRNARSQDRRWDDEAVKVWED